MDSSVPPALTLPGDVDSNDITAANVIEATCNGSELDDWTIVGTSPQLGPDRKVTVSTPRLFLLAVEYIEPEPDYARSAFSTFESGPPFSPQPSTSLSDFEHHVSPLDPNLSSAACYSPVYSSSSAVVTTDGSSTPGSPFPSQSVSSQVGQDGDVSNFNVVYQQNLSPHAVVTTHNVTRCSNNVLMHQYHCLSKGSANSLTGQSCEDSEEAKTEDAEDSNRVLLISDVSNIAYTLEPSAIFQTTPEELNNVLNTLKQQSFDGVDIESTLKDTNDTGEFGMDMLTVDEVILGDPYEGAIEAAEFEPPRRTKRQLDLSIAEHDNDEDCDCPDHHIQMISDKPVPVRAWATLPASYLAIIKIRGLDGQCGVFARKTIPKRTQFGPIEGILTTNEAPEIDMSGIELLVESETGSFLKLDISDENTSNWMRFVRRACTAKEQNLALSQNGESLYFTTTRAIHPRQELLVWYSAPYALRRGLEVLQPCGVGTELDHTWPCFECSQYFSSSEALQKHLNIHETERDDGYCAKARKKLGRGLKRKAMTHFGQKKYKTANGKNEKNIYQCTTCHRTFPRSYSLKRHQLMHFGSKKYPCHLCGQNFSHIYNRERHIRKHLETNNSIFKKKLPGAWQCTHCVLTFDNPSVLNLHTLAHAAENLEENEIITGLPSDFTSVYHDGEFLIENGDLQCPQCTQEFSSKRELIDHVSAHAKLRPRLRGAVNPAKPCKCELCYKAFATDDRLQRHMLVHGTEESKPLQCDICFKRFLNNSALACHIKTHTEKKSFECPICKEVFDQVLSLKEHVHVHAPDGTFVCPQCSKMFDEYTLIRKHIRAFHSDRKHTCKHCAKLFPTLDKLRMHMLRHSDHREFLCANCGKQFKRKDKLKEHMKRMHSAEREMHLASKPHRSQGNKKFMPKVQVSPTDYHRFIYKCHTCLLGFKRRGMLVNHLAKRHPDISPDSVPELNLPILKTTRDYYCQYCDKVYKSSSKRKAHILKNHPGLELPMSNRRKGGVPEIPGVPNPTYSQTVGSVTTNPHGCPWCHKQYASKAKLLQHQRKKHMDLLPRSQQLPRVLRTPTSPGGPEGGKLLSPTTPDSADELEAIGISIAATRDTDYIVTQEEIENSPDYEDSVLMKGRSIKLLSEPDLLTQAMCELSQTLGEFRVSDDQYQQLLKEVSFTPYTAR